jgi:hypothetical protein
MVKVLVLAGGVDESRPTLKEVTHEAFTFVVVSSFGYGGDDGG